MSVWASRSQGAVAFAVCLADGDIAGEAEAKALSKEGCEGEFVIAGIAIGLCREDAGSRAVNICCHVDLGS